MSRDQSKNKGEEVHRLLKKRTIYDGSERNAKRRRTRGITDTGKGIRGHKQNLKQRGIFLIGKKKHESKLKNLGGLRKRNGSHRTSGWKIKRKQMLPNTRVRGCLNRGKN